MAKPPVLVLLGPTAVGKTQLAMALQDYFGGIDRVQLISVDSVMVYRGMDIGSAKPTVAQQSQYPHALIDINDPAEPYSAADFVRDADVAVKKAHAESKLPILVGGTLLYARCFQHGIAELPHADAQIRAELEDEYIAKGGQELHAELLRADVVAAAKIDPNNKHRLLRALEVHRLTGRPMSELWQERRGDGAVKRLGCDLSVISVESQDRSIIHGNIEKRFDSMLKAGFLEEVQKLRQRDDLHLQLPAVRAVGYRQAWLYLAGELTETQFRANALTATRRLAKRQMTWLRQWPELERFEQSPTDGVFERVQSYLENWLDR